MNVGSQVINTAYFAKYMHNSIYYAKLNKMNKLIQFTNQHQHKAIQAMAFCK